MPEYRITGEVVLDVEAIGAFDGPPDREHAANIINGGFHNQSVEKVEVRNIDVERLEVSE